MVNQGAILMVSFKDQSWNHRDMDFCGIKFRTCNDNQPCLLFLGKVEKISNQKDSGLNAVYGLILIKHKLELLFICIL